MQRHPAGVAHQDPFGRARRVLDDRFAGDFVAMDFLAGAFAALDFLALDFFADDFSAVEREGR
jgi:hypothetical protein